MYNPKYIYVTESGRYKLTPEGEDLLRQRYATTPNKLLKEALGCSYAILYRFTVTLGLQKDAVYHQRVLHDSMLHARTYYVADRANNPERYREIDRCRLEHVNRLRRRDWFRIISGEEPHYNFHYAPAHSKKIRLLRQRLWRHYYIPYTRYRCKHWYFAPETKRCLKIEAEAKELGFKFSCFR